MELSDSVSNLPFVGPSFEKKLKRLDILTISDLLHHIPHRYLDFSKFTKVKDVKTGEIVSIFGEITSIVNQPTKSGKLMQIGSLEDSTGKINIIWFNQYYLTKTLFPGTKLIISGKATWFNRKLAFFTPQYEIMDYPHESVHTGKIIGVYPATTGLSNKWLKARIKYALDRINLKEFLINKMGMMSFGEAINKVHFPKDLNEAKMARDRLAFNEFYNLLIKAKKRKLKNQTKKSIALKVDHNKINKFVSSLPFKLTNSQNKVVKEILVDLENKTSMNRLLQGDVGSGKTVVATVASYVSYSNGYQTILLAPTQILASQHYKTLTQLFSQALQIDKSLGQIRIELITGNTKKIEEADIYVGTHALLNKKFENAGLVIIDEQHKFGVKQIDTLANSADWQTNRLTMTATPIPRTIAQTMFSDMDLSIIDEIPGNRPKIKTWLVPNEKRENAYKWIETQIKTNKSQAFVICPLVEESEAETLTSVKSVKVEYQKLKLVFPNLNLGLLHGKLKDNQKDKVINEFKDGKIDILVSTPVVEVGIDVPNATIMFIDGADRFGLAQLHQLRGRVGRGSKESYCLLFTENNSDKTLERLSALTKTTSGFELAELDLKLRGAGEVLGIKQSGFGNLKIANWSDTKLIRLASEAVLNV